MIPIALQLAAANEFAATKAPSSPPHGLPTPLQLGAGAGER